MYKIKVNNKFSFELNTVKDDFIINGDHFSADMVQTGQNQYHLIHQNRSYNAEVVDVNRAEKTCSIKVNGNIYSVELKDQYDQLLQQLGMDKLASSRVAELKAPMPGLVLSVMVKEGDHVKKGDNLLVLEAMKMENIIKSPGDLTIKAIKVNPGDKVEKNQIMLSFS